MLTKILSTKEATYLLMGILIAAASLIASVWKIWRDQTERKRDAKKHREYICFLFVTTQYDPEGEDLQKMLHDIFVYSDINKISKEYYAFRNTITTLRSVPMDDPDRKIRLLMAMMDIKLHDLRSDLCRVMQKAVGRKPLPTIAPLLHSHCTAPKFVA